MTGPARLGWIGLGKMGQPMALNLLKAGAPLTVYNRNRERSKPLLAAGAREADSPRAVGMASDLVFTMVADDQALQEVALGPRGAVGGLRPGALLIDMSTVSPAVSSVIATVCRDSGVGYVRAPVSGSVSFARAGKLTVLASGSHEDVEQCRPYFEHLARKTFYVGEQEAARTLKLVLNMMVGTTAAMLGEALALGKQAGLDWSSMIEVVGESVVASPLVSYKLPLLAERDFTAAFEARLMAKDFDLLLDVADLHGVAMPIAVDVRNYWRSMIELGMGDLDFSACVVVAERSVKDRAKSLR